MRRRKEGRKQIALETVAFIIGLIIFLLVVGRVGYWEMRYEMECKVIKVVDNIATLEDSSGHLWEVEDDTIEVGKTYIVVFFNGATDNRQDDEIEKIKNRVDN